MSLKKHGWRGRWSCYVVEEQASKQASKRAKNARRSGRSHAWDSRASDILTASRQPPQQPRTPTRRQQPTHQRKERTTISIRIFVPRSPHTHTHTLSLIATYVTRVRSTRTSRIVPGPESEDTTTWSWSWRKDVWCRCPCYSHLCHLPGACYAAQISDLSAVACGTNTLFVVY